MRAPASKERVQFSRVTHASAPLSLSLSLSSLLSLSTSRSQVHSWAHLFPGDTSVTFLSVHPGPPAIFRRYFPLFTLTKHEKAPRP